MAVLLNTSVLARIFHKFPHLDFNFYNTTTIFTPDSARYQQALLFNGIYLLFASIVLFVLFTIYFLVCLCYFCTSCRPQPLKPKPSKSRCLRLLICFLAIVSCSALGLAFYANNKTQDGIEDFVTAALNIFQIFDLYHFKNVVIEKYIVGVLAKLAYLENGIYKDTHNTSQLVTQFLHQMNGVNVDLKYAMNLLNEADINTQRFANSLSLYDSWRWWVTLCTLLWHGLLVLVVVYSTYTQRRCSFVVLTIMAVVSLFLMMTIVSVDTPISIGAADLCVHPRQSVLQYARQREGKDVLAHFITCPNNSTDGHLTKPYNNMSSSLVTAVQLAKSLEGDPNVKRVNNSKEYITSIQTSIDQMRDELSQLISDLGCKQIKQNYETGIEKICQVVLDGLGLLIVTSFVISLLLVFILLCITPVWKAMSPLRPILKRDKYGVHLVTESYQGPPGGSDSYHGSSSFDVSYKSLDDPEEFEHLPLINKRERPPSYRAILGSSEFMSLEEDRRIGYDRVEQIG